ncbi:amidohydrolase family protein [Phyllobacterium sp. BT25]|uniref:Amidohydrolase family protein n=1 Tax=Phyllobacterium pellucidum TaxID=2740464 RepID=A0A849VTB4_9HYPH|nr:amidohydrolase family protein [Phyllobacterium pellucidum]NTS33212.1 amidohydrolase family protein [Phyllobacterium pellucidum]
MTEKVTVIRDAAWIVAWDAETDAHIYMNDGDVAFSSAGVMQVGGHYVGAINEEISGTNLMVMPGLVNIHCHSGDEPLAKGLFEDAGTPALWGNALYEFSALLDADEDAQVAAQTVMLGDLMRSGVTTMLDIAGDHPRWISTMAESGLRGYLAPGFRQAQWRVVESHRLDFDWDDAAGNDRFRQALTLVDEISAHESGRLQGVVAPSQIETCRPELMAEAADEARRRGAPITIHAAQTMTEHEELLRRHGRTAIQHLDAIGILGPDLILGHCIFADHHSWTRQRTRNDIVRLSETGTAVAHCPVTFARSGMTLETIGAYQRAGVTIGIGTDSYPFNMLEEMRQALICARIAGRNFAEIDTQGVFNAATIGGAKALGRDDIGRLEVGAKADLVLIDIATPGMQPVHDPLRNLLHCAAERAVRDVFVDGSAVVRNHAVANLDYEGAVRELQDAQKRMIARSSAGGPAFGKGARLSLAVK